MTFTNTNQIYQAFTRAFCEDRSMTITTTYGQTFTSEPAAFYEDDSENGERWLFENGESVYLYEICEATLHGKEVTA